MSPLRILLVEDEAVISMDLELRLNALGHEVVGTPARGEDAVQLCDDLKPDVVLMDVYLLGPMNGIEAARQIHERNGTPVILLTALGDETLKLSAEVSQCRALLSKPFDMQVLEQALFKATAPEG